MSMHVGGQPQVPEMRETGQTGGAGGVTNAFHLPSTLADKPSRLQRPPADPLTPEMMALNQAAAFITIGKELGG